MKRFSLALLVLLAGVAAADDKADLKSMTGTWTTDKVLIGGAETSFDVTLVIDGNNYTVTIGKSVDKGTVTIDSSKTPKTIDIVGTEGVNKGKKYLAIYEVSDKELKICYSLDDAPRPTKFESPKDSKTMLAVYKKK